MKHFAFILLATPLIACSGSETPASTPASSSTPAPTPVKAELDPMARGAVMFKRCRSCHTLEDGEKHKVGPNLWGVYGAKAASRDFNYSKALQAKDIVWNDETMDAYIKKPSDFVPGGRMSFVGIKKQEDRDALQLYLKAETGAAE